MFQAFYINISKSKYCTFHIFSFLFSLHTIIKINTRASEISTILHACVSVSILVSESVL